MKGDATVFSKMLDVMMWQVLGIILLLSVVCGDRAQQNTNNGNKHVPHAKRDIPDYLDSGDELVRRWVQLFDTFDMNRDDVIELSEQNIGVCSKRVMRTGKIRSTADEYCKRWLSYFSKVLMGKSHLSLKDFLDKMVRKEERYELVSFMEDVMEVKVKAMDINADGYITHPDEWDMALFGFPLDGYHVIVDEELQNALVRYYTDQFSEWKI